MASGPPCPECMQGQMLPDQFGNLECKACGYKMAADQARNLSLPLAKAADVFRTQGPTGEIDNFEKSLYAQGYGDALRNEQPKSDESQYMAGWQAGR